MRGPAPLVLLDRDGVVVRNRPTNIKLPSELELLPGVTGAIATLKSQGFKVALCTNQPEVGRGVMTRADLDRVHDALQGLLAPSGAAFDAILVCTSTRKCPRLKPFAGMLHEALALFGAVSDRTPFVGDQAADLKAAFHARCRRVLVRTGLGRRTMTEGLPTYVEPVLVAEDLKDAIDRLLSESSRPIAA